jgi:hypothetical protein
MPAPQECGFVFTHHQNDTCQFAARKAATFLGARRIQPDLGAVGISFDVHMRQPCSIAGEKEEPVWTETPNSRHGE